MEVRLVAGECDDLSVAFSRLAMVAFGLAEPAKTLVAVVHAGEARQHVVGGRRCRRAGLLARGRFVAGHAAAVVFLAAAAGAGIIPSDFFCWLANVSAKDGPLYQAVLAGAGLHEQLLIFDRGLSATARAAGRDQRGGPLHAAPFGRERRGGPAGLGQD